MKKQIHSFGIGNKKRLVLEVDPDDKNETEFLKDCEQVADAKPATIQDFFIALARIRREKDGRPVAENDQGKRRKR